MSNGLRSVLLAGLVAMAGLTGSSIPPARGGEDEKPRTRYRPACCAVWEIVHRWGCMADPVSGADAPPLRRTACPILLTLSRTFCDIYSCSRE
jgi:hypothetical protein